jgi:hypothetical protein
MDLEPDSQDRTDGRVPLSHTMWSGLSMLDPYAPEVIADPVPFWASLREEAPVFEVPGSPGHFLVSRSPFMRWSISWGCRRRIGNGSGAGPTP